MLLREHRGPLTADFQRYYGLRLSEALGGPRWSLLEVADLAAHLPHDSAVERAADPDWWVTPHVRLLRDVEHAVRHGLWLRSRGKSYVLEPEPQALVEEEHRAKAEVGAEQPAPISMEEARRRLGWPESA